jgi:hypothetical protein
MTHPLAFIGFAPIYIWTVEIVEGYLIMFLFDGKNIAWEYSGSDALFDGNIKIAHCKLWWVLGAGMYATTSSTLCSVAVEAVSRVFVLLLPLICGAIVSVHLLK